MTWLRDNLENIETVFSWVLGTLLVVGGYYLPGYIGIYGFSIVVLVLIIFNMYAYISDDSGHTFFFALSCTSLFFMGFVPGLIVSHWHQWMG